MVGDCKAQTVVSILDACRDAPIDLYKALTIDGRPLRSAPSNLSGNRDAPIFRAASRGQKAHAFPGPIVSCFTRVLLDSLERLGGNQSPYTRGWGVTTNSLKLALNQLMAITTLPNGRPGGCDTGGGVCSVAQPTTLHPLPGVGSARVRLSYDPDSAHEYAQMELTRDGRQMGYRAPHPGPWWEDEVEAGSYDLAATFPGGQYTPRSQTGLVLWPPYTPYTLR